MDATIPPPPPATSGLHDDPRGIPAALAGTARAVLDPSGLGAPPPHLPLISEVARRRHHVFVPADYRFKAAARFLQALWREDRGLPIGTHIDRAIRSTLGRMMFTPSEDLRSSPRASFRKNKMPYFSGQSTEKH